MVLAASRRHAPGDHGLLHAIPLRMFLYRGFDTLCIADAPGSKPDIHVPGLVNELIEISPSVLRFPRGDQVHLLHLDHQPLADLPDKLRNPPGLLRGGIAFCFLCLFYQVPFIARRSTSRHTNSKDKKRMLKAARGKQQKGNSYERLSADFSVETLLVTSEWHDIFKAIKGKTCSQEYFTQQGSHSDLMENAKTLQIAKT